jgi:hypothetical protein
MVMGAISGNPDESVQSIEINPPNQEGALKESLPELTLVTMPIT